MRRVVASGLRTLSIMHVHVRCNCPQTLPTNLLHKPNLVNWLFCELPGLNSIAST